DHYHSGWTEIHEARAIAVLRQVDASTSYAAVNAFFVAGTRQQDVLHRDIRVPRPGGAGATLAYTLVATPAAGCALKPGVSISRLVGSAAPRGQHGVCTHELRRGAI